jgi:hypothetical protein
LGGFALDESGSEETRGIFVIIRGDATMASPLRARPETGRQAPLSIPYHVHDSVSCQAMLSILGKFVH